jgi:glutamate synthase domain-containing protein 1
MGFPQAKVNQVVVKNWDRLKNDINTAVEMLLEECEEKKQEIIEIPEPNLKKIRSDILQQRNIYFNEESLENEDDDDFIIKRWISKTLFIKPQSKPPETMN